MKINRRVLFWVVYPFLFHSISVRFEEVMLYKSKALLKLFRFFLSGATRVTRQARGVRECEEGGRRGGGIPESVFVFF